MTNIDLRLRHACQQIALNYRRVLTDIIRAELIAEAQANLMAQPWFTRGVTKARKRKPRNSRPTRIFQVLQQHQWLTSSEIANAIQVSGHDTCRLLRHLVSAGKLERRGDRKRYEYALAVPAAEQAAE